MITLRAPAKINWFLHVLSRRADGYHDILSLMQRVTLYDSILFEHSNGMEVISEATVSQKDNLVYKAMVLLKEISGIQRGARIVLDKEIPMAAGLGGGSSDAASTLAGLARLWNLNLSRNDLAAIGERIGADVPFFFDAPASLAEGKGEILSPVVLTRAYFLLLVKPRVDVSTEWAYAEFDRGHAQSKELTKKTNNIKLFCQALERGDFSLLSSLHRNDLEPLVIERYPVVGDIKLNLTEEGALFSAMSGSGPTVFGVFEAEERALEAKEHMPPHWSRVVQTMVSDGLNRQDPEAREELQRP